MSSVATKLVAAMEALKAEVEAMQAEIDRLQTIKATIRINAMRLGASDDQIERLIDGREDFIKFAIAAIEKGGDAVVLDSMGFYSESAYLRWQKKLRWTHHQGDE